VVQIKNKKEKKKEKKEKKKRKRKKKIKSALLGKKNYTEIYKVAICSGQDKILAKY